MQNIPEFSDQIVKKRVKNV